jgi:hypothetical protein
MSSHLPRVVLWATNRSVQIYPTADYSQVLMTPWAEFAMLHLYLLWGGDRLVNLVEFASLVGTTVTVSSIATTFGASRFIQIITAIISATIPEGVLEASGAMNTYVGTFWMTTAAYFVLRWNAQPSWLDLFGFSGAANLAALTTGTASVFLPFVLLRCWWIGTPAARRLLVMRLVVRGELRPTSRRTPTRGWNHSDPARHARSAAPPRSAKPPLARPNPGRDSKEPSVA